MQKHGHPADQQETTQVHDITLRATGSATNRNREAPLNILLIDKRRGYADMLARILREKPEVNVTELDDLASLSPDTCTDLILFQLDTLWENLSTFADRQRSLLPSTRCFVIGDRYSDTQLDTLLRLKLTGLLTSNQPLAEIIDAILSDSHAVPLPQFSPEVADRLEYNAKHDVYLVKRRNAFMQLTLRQMDVLIQIARGGSVKEVASRMYLSERAIESHKYRIMRKLDVQDRVELCLFAVREGVIQV